MEDGRKRKLLATASCQGLASDCLMDRLSELPEEVAHHILSFLEIKDLTCFGCVSKRCRKLYLSTPSLKFDGFFSKQLQRYDERLRLWSYLDNYLFHRWVSRIQRFHFHWVLHSYGSQQILLEDEKFRLDKFICNAIKCNVEVLDIKIRSWGSGAPLPTCVLHSGSLKSLSVYIYGRIIKAPSLASFSNLECLKLEGIVLVDDGLFNWISCSCKCIKELSLKSVSMYNATSSCNVTIESSSLESLCIERLSFIHHLYIAGEKLEQIIIDWRFGFRSDKPHSDKSLGICAPNLNSLNWRGSLMNQPNLGRLECLEEASICLLPSVDEFVYVSEVLSCLSSAKVLTLNKETTMALFKGGSMPLLENVWYLCIHIEGFLDFQVPAMASLLGGMSKLNTLIIKSDSFFRGPKAECCGFNIGYWKLQNAAFIYQLKEVTVELSHGSNGIEFARYILDHAQNLNKMTIVHSPQQSSAMSELKKSKMASNITLVFQEDQERGPQNRTRRRVV
ncbi:hypothetical protein ACLB2K_055216 [Fragaria x ananassa]